MAKRALLSVYDKTGLAEFGRGLAAMGWELVSTGGTARALREAGVQVADVAEITGFPEILDGRVKTLHPAVFGGILGRRDDQAHLEQMAANRIAPLDLVAVNLYPFRATVERPDVTLDIAVENIDIGGPSMIRAAAKNHAHVIVVTDPADYATVLEALRAGAGSVDASMRYRLACDAFAHTAAYDAAIAEWLGRRIGRTPAERPAKLVLYFEKAQDLSYGENPHQHAAFYREPFAPAGLLAGMAQLQGKPLSFNNLNDAQGAVAAVSEHTGPAAVAVKHATPCGVGTAASLAGACRKAYDADPVSIYGGIVAVNRPFDAEAAEVFRKVHLDVLIAPSYTPEALSVLSRKTNLRLLALGSQPGPGYQAAGDYDLKRVGGGLLMQVPDYREEDPAEWRVVTKRRPSDGELLDLAFAWKVVKHVRSNAIVLARDGMTIGIGGGQTNRVDSARIAAGQAGEKATGAVLASDAYIPFRDTIDVASAAGVRAVVEPGGSIRDGEAIAAADEAGMAMVFTGVRHLRH